MLGDTCSICPKPTKRSEEDVHGRIHRACAEHERYLDGWIRDVEAEQASECAAARRFEREYE